MPVLNRPSGTHEIMLPPRAAILAHEADVLVVGGGPAGLGAALGAAWAGAKVVLVERHGFFGGNATVALVMPWMSFYTQTRPPENSDNLHLLPVDHGPGEPVVGGALQVFLERLVARDAAISPSLATGYTVPFDPEALKCIAMDVLDEAGVQYLFHAFASGVVNPASPPDGVVFETKSGPVVIRARAVVDCTGDGDVAAQAGAGFDIGREDDGLMQPMTLMFRMMDFFRPDFLRYVQDNPGQWRGVHGLWELVERARQAGELELPREDILFFATPHQRELSFNCTRVTGVSGVDVWDLGRAEWLARRQMRQIVEFMKKYVPGFADAYAGQTGVQVGVRETRRIRGDYTLTSDDVMTARKFSDGIARGSYPIDIHNPKGKGTLLQRLPPGEAYDIPLRCLLPKDVEGLLVAGRCLSGTHEAHASYRVTPVAMATGQAAGVCAALASRQGVMPRQVDANAVRDVLRNQGASLS